MEDKRTQKTKAALGAALINISETNTINSISVTDICVRANVSRSAFYSHYGNIAELIEEIEQDFIKDMNFDQTLYTFHKEDSEIILRYIMKRREVFLFLLKYGKLKEYITNHFNRLLSVQALDTYPPANIEITNVYSHFITDGILSVICYYLENHKTFSAVKVTEIIYDLVIATFPTMKDLMSKGMNDCI